MSSRTAARSWLLVCLFLLSAGCGKMAQITGSTWHARCGWKAEEYFTDPQVIALCRAIEANDLEEIDRLVAAGADVNARGRDNMTPLLWAFPDDRLDRFRKLLEHGADPNVIVESDFNSRGGIHPGHSVLHLAAGSRFIEHFTLALQHGGDPDLIDGMTGESLAHVIVKASISQDSKKARLQLLVDRHADLNQLSNGDKTPVMNAISWFGQYELALWLLDAGADPLIYQNRGNQRLVHFVVREEQVIRNPTAGAAAAYQEIVRRLEVSGESLEDARKDLERWSQRGQLNAPAKVRILREQEVAERKARQKAEAEAAARGE